MADEEMVRQILDLLDEMNAESRINYADYANLHGMVGELPVLAEKRAEWEAEQGEPEWEWAVESTYPYSVVHSGWTDEETAREIASWPITDGDRRLVRRRKAGPTLPVPDTTTEGDENQLPPCSEECGWCGENMPRDTTNHEVGSHRD